MAAPDPAVVERQFYASLLNIDDDGTLSFAELRSLTGGGAWAASAVQATNTTNVQGLGVSYVEYVNVSGAITIDARKSTHSIEMVGDTDVTLTNPVEGMTVGIWGVGDFALTVEGYTITTKEAVAVYIRDTWEVRIVGAATDAALPTAGTLGIVTGSTTADLTVTGAMDNVALDANPYAFRYATTPDGGATWDAYGAWSAYQVGNTLQYTGLVSGGTYKFQHRVKDAAGNINEGAEVIRTTSLTPTWADIATWVFTAADNTELNGFARATGSDGALVAPASNLGASPPINNNVLTNKARVKADGNTQEHYYGLTTPKARGIGIEASFAMGAINNTTIALAVGTNSAGSNQIGFQIGSAGAVTAFHFAAGSTVYTELVAGAVPKTAVLKAEFSKNLDGTCLGTLYVDGVAKGTVASSGWTWQGKHIMLKVGSNQTDSTYDDVRLYGATV